jgi:hypothetical protein
MRNTPAHETNKIKERLRSPLILYEILFLFHRIGSSFIIIRQIGKRESHSNILGVRGWREYFLPTEKKALVQSCTNGVVKTIVVGNMHAVIISINRKVSG